MVGAERYLCTVEQPWTKDKGRSLHPDAQRVQDTTYGWPNGDNYDTYECPNCQLRFQVTLPDS